MNTREKIDKMTCLHFCAKYGYVRLIYELLENNYKFINPLKINNEGLIPRKNTAYNGIINKLLLKSEKRYLKNKL